VASATNEELIGKANAGRRDEVVLGTKFRGEARCRQRPEIVIDGRPELCGPRHVTPAFADWAPTSSTCTTTHPPRPSGAD